MGKYTLTVRRIGLSSIVTPLVYLSNIILLPILTRSLPIADYGAFALIMVTLSLLPPLVALGLPYALVRFGAAAKERADIRELFYSMGFVVLVSSLAVCGLLLLFAAQIAASLFGDNLIIALLLIANILIACLIFFVTQYFVTFQQIKRYTWLNLLNAYSEHGPRSLFCPRGLRTGGRRNRTHNPTACGILHYAVSHHRGDWFCDS